MAAQHFFAKAWSLSFERFSQKNTRLFKKSPLNLLRSGIAADYDNIPISTLKNSVSVISEPIAHITHSHPVIFHIPTFERRKFKISWQVFTPL
jgi:hypothetical protein